jgi:hypothetical protein
MNRLSEEQERDESSICGSLPCLLIVIVYYRYSGLGLEVGLRGVGGCRFVPARGHACRPVVVRAIISIIGAKITYIRTN